MQDKNQGAVSRRRVIQGAAWATPAVLIATGSPPAAASTKAPTIETLAASTTGLTVARVVDATAADVLSLRIVVRVNKTVSSGSNYNAVSISGYDTNLWTVTYNQNPVAASQAKHSPVADIILDYKGGAITGSGSAQVAWVASQVASFASVTVSGSYGPAGGAALGTFGPTIIYSY